MSRIISSYNTPSRENRGRLESILLRKGKQRKHKQRYMAQAYVDLKRRELCKKRLFCDETITTTDESDRERHERRSRTPLSMPSRCDPDSIVWFFAYCIQEGGPYYCGDCFEIGTGTSLTIENETKYISTGEKEALDFSKSEARDPLNHCYLCKIKLYKFQSKTNPL